MCFRMFWSIKHCIVLIILFEPSPGLLCNIQIAGFDLCEFADISHGLFMCVVNEGLHCYNIFNDSWVECFFWCGQRCLFDVRCVAGGSIPGGGVQLEQKMEYVCVHMSIHGNQKVWIAQKTACKLYTCNLWRHFRCCQCGDMSVFTMIVSAES